MRVGIIALHHESNSFLPQPTTLENFRADTIATGEAIHKLFAASHHEIGGFFEGLTKQSIDPIPIFAARAIPSGVITAQTANALVEQILKELDDADHLDGLLIAAHGAAVAENHRDFDGHWLSRVRERFGSSRPIVCTLDLHANVSQRMIDACDATIAYRTNPHLDQRDRGIEAAKILARTLRGEVKPKQAVALPPIAINIERQLSEASPTRELMAFVDEIRNRPGVLSASAVLGFPYADVAEMGSSFIVATNDDLELAKSLANEIAQYVVQRRHSFDAELISVDTAIDDAMQRPGPVCLLDIGDNVGGGSPGDGTALAHALASRHTRSLVCINDPVAVQAIKRATPGASSDLEIGGKLDTLQGPPLSDLFHIRSLHTGQFAEPAPRHGGKTHYDMGLCAVVDTAGGLTILLTSRRTPPFSLNQLLSCDLDPAQFQIIVVKGVHAPVAAYGRCVGVSSA